MWIVGKPGLAKAVGIHDVDLVVPVLFGVKDDLCAVGPQEGFQSSAGSLVRLVRSEPPALTT